MNDLPYEVPSRMTCGEVNISLVRCALLPDGAGDAWKRINGGHHQCTGKFQQCSGRIIEEAFCSINGEKFFSMSRKCSLMGVIMFSRRVKVFSMSRKTSSMGVKFFSMPRKVPTMRVKGPSEPSGVSSRHRKVSSRGRKGLSRKRKALWMVQKSAAVTGSSWARGRNAFPPAFASRPLPPPPPSPSGPSTPPFRSIQ